jgi:hypothetical protein
LGDEDEKGLIRREKRRKENRREETKKIKFKI